MINVLNLGAGVQSSTLLLMSCKGVLPRLDAAVFADTQWEPPAVYTHLEWLTEIAATAGIPVYRVTAGNLRQDGIDVRRLLVSADGKRWVSIPLFIKNPDGSQGRVKRQCTKEYKIEPCERFIVRQLLGLKAKQRRPREIVVRTWFGISADESQRAAAPGRLVSRPFCRQDSLFGGESKTIARRVWNPTRWKTHVYPLLNLELQPDRSSRDLVMLPLTMTRHDCLAWLAEHYPAREFPRSACIGCPFRTNREWRQMRDHAPADWADAVAFDEEIRVADKASQAIGRRLVGDPYVHRQLLPLRLVDLDGASEKTGGGCGSLFGEDDGMCGL